MRIKNTNTTIFERGDTRDIINVVMMAYDVENDEQIEALAYELRGQSETESCRNVWQYLIDNIQYRADVGRQDVKTPARLIHDRVGDCKSYSILIATVLRYLGIKHFFRFVSYDRRREATHVYIVACIDGQNVPIDAVAAVQANTDFGKELKYTYRVDMADRTTKIAYLAGLSDRAMIGDVQEDDTDALLPHQILPSWNDNENMDSHKKAYTYLTSEWDKNWVIYAVARTNARIIEVLNELQYIAQMIVLFQDYHTDNEMLERLGVAMGYLIEVGAFDSDEIDPERRDFFSTDKEQIVKHYVSISDTLPYNNAFMRVWNENVVKENVYPTDGDGQIMSIGAVSSVTQDFYDTGSAYLYSYMSESDARYAPAKVSAKRTTQIAMKSWFASEAASSVSASTQANKIYSGCTAKWGGTPEDVLSDLKSGKAAISGVSQIGWIDIAFTVAGLVISIVFKLSAYFKKKKATPAEKDINDMHAKPGEDGYVTSSGGSSSNNSTSGKGKTNTTSKAGFSGVSLILPIALLGGLLMRGSNKKSASGKSKKTIKL